jgi:hypothetical protein
MVSIIDADASLSDLKTGDLVLFTGQGLARGLARWFNRSPWTHIGLVLRGPEAGEPLLWEALCGGPRRGTLAVPLSVRMARSRGRISARCLNRPLAPAQCQRLETLRQEVAERVRPRGLFDLIGAADDGWVGARRDNLGEPMDGELVAEAYQRIGLLDDIGRGGKAPGDYRPWHFCARHGLELKNGYALGPELVLRDAERPVGWTDMSPQPAGT